MKGFFTKEERIAFGLRYEPLLMPVLCKTLNDTIKKTDYCFSLMDFEGEETWSELKVRSSDYSHTDECMKEGWLIPAAKMIWASHKLSEGKDIYFFYLWERDGSLWSYKFHPADMNKFKIGVPNNHAENQLHYWIPVKEWEFIARLKIEPSPFSAPKQCFISDE